jgi:hypothetical protein
MARNVAGARTKHDPLVGASKMILFSCVVGGGVPVGKATHWWAMPTLRHNSLRHKQLKSLTNGGWRRDRPSPLANRGGWDVSDHSFLLAGGGDLRLTTPGGSLQFGRDLPEVT